MQQVDIVIISNAKNHKLRKVTEDCLSSLLVSETDVQFQVVVVESVTGVTYDQTGVKTVYPKGPFGYHKYLNIGRKMGKAPYVCLCNNDLVFEKNWASEIIKVMKDNPNILSASPYCKNTHPGKGVEPDSGILEGHRIRLQIAGWCIFQQRAIYEIIGDLDESFIFWYADNDYGETLKFHKIKHALVTSSHVEHLISKTIWTELPDRRSQLTHRQRLLFEKKWKKSK